MKHDVVVVTLCCSAVYKMSDKEIIVRLAALVALVDDGHTRLTIPREHPEIGLEFGHTATSEPEHSALRFSQLPLAFEQFEDGVYVVAANSEYARLIGYRLDAIDSTPIAEAMTLELVDESGGVSKVSVEPLPTTALEWIAPSFANATPLRLKHPEEKFWSEYVDDGDFVYMQMDEIADGDIPLAEFVVNTLG